MKDKTLIRLKYKADTGKYPINGNGEVSDPNYFKTWYFSIDTREELLNDFKNWEKSVVEYLTWLEEQLINKS